MGARWTDLANQYADLKRLRKKVYLLEGIVAQPSRAKRARPTSERQSLKPNQRAGGSMQGLSSRSLDMTAP